MAIEEDGGVFYLDCDESANFQCQYNFNNSFFANNSATRNGGVFQYNFYAPEVENSNFTNNTAQYGSVYGSYATSLIYEMPTTDRRRLEDEATYKLTDEEVAALDLTNAIVYQSNVDFVSGSVMS